MGQVAAAGRKLWWRSLVESRVREEYKARLERAAP
jgi:hypothetical protein